LQRYDWPGNIRELRNVLERAMLLADSAELTTDVLRFDAIRTDAAGSDDMTLASLERAHVLRVLEGAGGHVERAAVRLGIARSSLYQKLRDYGVRSQ
ncbi:MAG TPA: helix-turn-helix domain-containing protein, partial [Thermoanaerobaculia bacterium]|nr:helix-turn-helix domain-containing protein [Thermoanaerobaculia bacterium]